MLAFLMQYHLPHWLQGAIAPLGGLGLLVVAFLDSSILAFPVVNDLLLIDLCVQNPERMPLYAALSLMGSVAGCILLYYVARRGGEAFLQKRSGARAHKIQHWVQHHGFITIVVGALLPPPTPFKAVVIAAGALDMPLQAFVLGLIVARTIRFFGEGFLAVRYGTNAAKFMVDHALLTAFGSVASAVLAYALLRLVFRPRRLA